MRTLGISRTFRGGKKAPKLPMFHWLTLDLIIGLPGGGHLLSSFAVEKTIPLPLLKIVAREKEQQFSSISLFFPRNWKADRSSQVEERKVSNRLFPKFPFLVSFLFLSLLSSLFACGYEFRDMKRRVPPFLPFCSFLPLFPPIRPTNSPELTLSYPAMKLWAGSHWPKILGREEGEENSAVLIWDMELWKEERVRFPGLARCRLFNAGNCFSRLLCFFSIFDSRNGGHKYEATLLNVIPA